MKKRRTVLLRATRSAPSSTLSSLSFFCVPRPSRLFRGAAPREKSKSNGQEEKLKVSVEKKEKEKRKSNDLKAPSPQAFHLFLSHRRAFIPFSFHSHKKHFRAAPTTGKKPQKDPLQMRRDAHKCPHLTSFHRRRRRHLLQRSSSLLLFLVHEIARSLSRRG